MPCLIQPYWTLLIFYSHQTNYKQAPTGYTFVAVGTAPLSNRCKELSKQRSLQVYVVNVRPLPSFVTWFRVTNSFVYCSRLFINVSRRHSENIRAVCLLEGKIFNLHEKPQNRPICFIQIKHFQLYPPQPPPILSQTLLLM